MAPAKLPPGLAYFLKRFFSPSTLAPIAGVIVLSRVLALEGMHVPLWAVGLLTVLSLPVTYALSIIFRERDVRQRAKRAGAILPPSRKGKKWGNLDLLTEALEKLPTGYPGEGFWDGIDECGGVLEKQILWDPLYMTSDANVVKTMLATDFQYWDKGEVFRDTLVDVLGTGVFNADGEMWKWHRTMTRPYFTRDRISHFELFNRHADFAIRKMKDRFAAGHALDFQDLVSRFTLDSASEFLFGNCVHSLKTDLPYAHNYVEARHITRVPSAADRFAEAFMGVQDALALRLRKGWTWRLAEMLKNLTTAPMEIVDAYLQPIMEEAIRKNKRAINSGKPVKANKAEEENEDGEAETLLDHLVKLTDDPTVLHDEVLNILIAGRDTTAATLTFVVYLLCTNPDVFKRLRAEVMEKVGPTQMPSFDDVRTMKYLRAVINETLRLYPVVPFNVRVPNQDVTIPNPDPTKPRIFVPANCGIAYSVFMMHRRKDYWGDDALYFNPERFLDERLNKYFTANPFIFLPFNAGPRICLGQQFAYNEMSFFLIRLLQNFSQMEMDLAAQPPHARPPTEWAGAEGQKGIEKIWPKAHLTLYVHGGLWVKMTEAEKDA